MIPGDKVETFGFSNSLGWNGTKGTILYIKNCELGEYALVGTKQIWGRVWMGGCYLTKNLRKIDEEFNNYGGGI